MNTYDTNLCKVVPATNYGSPIALNANFRNHQKHIEFNMHNRNGKEHAKNLNVEPEDIYQYNVGEFKELYLDCMKHAFDHNKELDKKNIISLTHPLYLHC